ncbi:MAG: HNH endonuclease, partial [Candidatus Melainabacteria bacterium]|nr:HNH endonuclease [Candidatus Melainabacteria bacterium]
GKLGHRPSKGEWIQSDSKISYQTFVRYFGGWQNACLKFIEYKMGRSLLLDTEIKSESKIKNSLKNKDINTVSKDSRTIPLGIRLKVLDRDNFRCIFCGCSPATDLGVKLHIDHIISYSKGGKSTLENLQTLCEKCNLGKSNKEIKLVK